MKTDQAKREEPVISWPYRLAFIVLTIAGALMIVAATVFEYTYPGETAAFSGFPQAAVVCFFVASLMYSKYLTVHRDEITASGQMKRISAA